MGGATDTPPTVRGDRERRETGLWVTLRTSWRFLVAVAQFLPLAIAYARDRRRFLVFGGRRAVTDEMRERRAQYLLETLLDLGPTFIKLGQVLSTRLDALPRQYIAALSELQDKVPPAPWPEAREVIEAEVGPVEEAYEEFDTDPISGASLGQVYVARYEGRKVAVKVSRPGVRELVEADLRVIRALLPVVIRFSPPGQAFTLENLADEFAKTIREEMDYQHEAARLKQIRSNFADEDRIVIPSVIDARSERRVLTMEFVEGTKITNVPELERMGINRTALATRLEEIYIQMIVEDGVFHADPHPGNLAVQPDGTIVFYDFGITGTLGQYFRDQILEFYVGIANDDVDQVIDAFIAMGALDPSVDRQLIAEAFELFLDVYRGRDVEVYRVQELIRDFEDTLYEFPLRLPRELALIVRVSTILEGVCFTLDPDFDFLEIVVEYVRDRGLVAGEDGIGIEVVRRIGSDLLDSARAVGRLPPKLDRSLDQLNRGAVSVQMELEDDRDLLQRLAKRLVFAVLATSGLLALAVLAPTHDPIALGGAGLWTVLTAYLFRRAGKERGVTAQPQFTRQAMREREATYVPADTGDLESRDEGEPGGASDG